MSLPAVPVAAVVGDHPKQSRRQSLSSSSGRRTLALMEQLEPRWLLAHGQFVIFGTAFGSGTPRQAGTEYFRALDGDTRTYFRTSSSTGTVGVAVGGTPGSSQRVTKIRFFPRGGYESRMVGGVFQASATSQTSGFVTLHRIGSQPKAGWNEVTINNSNRYRFFRYVAPSGSEAQVAEIEFRTDTRGIAATPLDSTDADKYVNQFMKKTIASGHRNVTAAGAWWGPTSKFFQNQLWAVVRDGTISGKVYSPGSKISVTYTALMPGKLPGKGNVKNTLSYPELRFNLRNDTPHVRAASPDNLEKWHTLSRTAPRDGSAELRPRVIAFETSDNPFDEPGVTGLKGDEVRAQMGFFGWFGDRVQEPAKQTNQANHLALQTHRHDVVDAHSWYDEGVGYSYAILDNGNDLIGKTVAGVIQIRGWAHACREPNCGDDPTHVPLHVEHHALKVESGDKDFWAATVEHPSGGHRLPNETTQANINAFTLDTRQLSNGWHILSYHMHVIDHRDIPGLKGKQLATEIKFPVLVNNSSSTSGTSSTTSSSGTDTGTSSGTSGGHQHAAMAFAPLAASFSSRSAPATLASAWSRLLEAEKSPEEPASAHLV
jgi:hypothetical protein